MKDMLKLEKSGDTAALAPYLQSLALPDSDAWFKSTFGKKWGAKLNQNYDVERLNLSKMMRSALNLFAKESGSTPIVVSFDGSCRSQATQQEFPLLLLHRKKFPLYSIRFRQSPDLSTLSMFAFVDGAFRYIGNLPGKMNQLARSGDAQRKVVLTGTMGRDGVLRRLARSSGPCWLEDLAIKATQQWHYAPTVLHGKPVEVNTTINVIFSAGS